MNTQMMNEITEVTRENPYMGPLSFTEDDKPWFFGRTKETNSLFSLLMARGLVLFYAQSGAGKTSLLNAGLIPTIREQTGDQFEILPVCRVGGQQGQEAAAFLHNWENPFVFNLLASMKIEVALEDVPPAQRTLPYFLSCLTVEGDRLLLAETSPAKRAPMVLIIDQFEEIFTHHIRLEQERIEFFQQLAQAIKENGQLYVVLAMREDYLARINPYVHLLPDSLRARFYMQRLQKEAALQAVCKPVEKLRPFTVDAAETLVNCLGRDVDRTAVSNGNPHLIIEAMQLQVVCYALWRLLQTQKEPDETISLKDIAWAAAKQHKDAKNLTGETAVAAFVNNALGRYYEEAIDHLKTMMPELTLRQWFSEKLITNDGTRGLQLWKNDQIPEPVMEALDTQWHLVQVVLRDKSKFVELVHDSFIEPVRKTNRQWYEKLERDIPWLNPALDFAQDPTNRSLLLTDFNRLQAAKEERDHAANKRSGLPGGLQEQLDSFLAESQAELDRQLAQDIPWINHAYKYAETKDDALLLSDGAALENAIALVKTKKQQGGLPIEVDNFLEACQEAERRREERRRKEAIKAKNKELENQRALAEAAEAKRQAEMERAEAHRRQAAAAEARHIAEKERANLEAIRAKDAKIAAAKQGTLFRWAALGGFVALIFAVIAGISYTQADKNKNLAEIRQATAEAASTAAVIAQNDALEQATKVANARDDALEAQATAEELRVTAEAESQRAEIAEKSALAFLAFTKAQDALEMGELESALLLSRIARQTALNNNAAYLATGVSTNDIDGILLTTLSQMNQTISDEDENVLRERFQVPNNVGFISNLLPGNEAGTFASVTEYGLYMWAASASEATPIVLPFNANAEYAVAPNSYQLAVEGTNEDILLYDFDSDGRSFIPVGSSIPYILQDEFSDTTIGKMVFDDEGSQLGLIACGENGCLIVRKPLEVEDVHFCRLSFNLGKPDLVFLGSATLLVSSHSDKEGTRLLKVTVEEQGKECELEPVPQGLNEITHLAILPERKLVMTAGGRQLQWWRIEEGDQLVPASSAVNLAARIVAITSLTDQATFAILDENKQITQYSADFDAQQLSQWACAAAGRDLNATEWSILNPDKDILDFNPDTDYQPVCRNDYPFPISFAEQALTLCKAGRSWGQADDLYRETNLNDEFVPWAVTTLMDRFYENELDFIVNNCWEFIGAQRDVGLELGQNLEAIAKDIRQLESSALRNNSDEFEESLNAILSNIDELGEEYANVFDQTLQNHYRDFCLNQGFARACGKLAERHPLTFGGEPEEGDIGEITFWQLPVEAESIVSINMTAVDNTFTPYFDLFDSEGAYLASSQLSADGKTATLESFFIPDEQEQFFLIQTWGYDGAASGTYQISATQTNLDTFKALDLEKTTPGSLEQNPLWRLELQEEIETVQLIRIQMRSIDQPSLAPYLTLLDASGREIQTVSRADSSLAASEATFLIDPNNIYYIRVAGYNGEPEGQYTIRAELVDIPSIDDETDSNPLTGNTADQPLWSLNGNAGQTITISMNETDDVLDTFLVLYDANGEEIAFNDDSNDSLNSLIEITLPESGQYFISTQGYGGASGTYELTVRRVDS